ncbi:MAG: flagellar export protein FliJ [Lachnospiraceae bacterium]|nr:flagellar export protein FliJ [Lachnospiraceae bacterium]
MPRFRYRMQSILDIKLKLEEQARNEFAQAQMILNEEEEKKRQLQGRLAAYEEEGKRLREDVLKPRELNENATAVDTMKDMIKQQEFVIVKARTEVEKKRDALSEVMQERKMHEKLKEKALEEYLEEEKAAEMKAIDELTSFKYGGNRAK